MPFTTVGYYESQDSAVLVNIAAIADPHVTVTGDNIYVPGELPFLAGFYFHGVNFTQGQIASPTLRRLANIDVEPADLAAEPGSPPAMHDLFSTPKGLTAGEAVTALMAEDAAGASAVQATVWFSSGPIAPATGEIFTVRATSATTLVANAWTNGALTFSQTLPVGTYDVVGMRAQSAGMKAARLVFTGYSWRPGCLGCDADGDLDAPAFRNGRAGIWGSFAHTTPPTVDFLSISADAAEVVHLDLIKTT